CTHYEDVRMTSAGRCTMLCATPFASYKPKDWTMGRFWNSSASSSRMPVARAARTVHHWCPANSRGYRFEPRCSVSRGPHSAYLLFYSENHMTSQILCTVRRHPRVALLAAAVVLSACASLNKKEEGALIGA